MKKHRVDKPHNLYHISIPPKLVLGLFDNINFKTFFFAYRRYNNKLNFSNNLSLDVLHGAYSFGDLIFFHWSWPLSKPLSLLGAAAVISRIVTMLYLHRSYYSGMSNY